MIIMIMMMISVELWGFGMWRWVPHGFVCVWRISTKKEIGSWKLAILYSDRFVCKIWENNFSLDGSRDQIMFWLIG